MDDVPTQKFKALLRRNVASKETKKIQSKQDVFL